MSSAKLPSTQLEKTTVKTESKSERTDAEATQAKVELILATAIAQENHGHIFPGVPEFCLLIDIKSDAGRTYPVLRALLSKYAGY